MIQFETRLFRKDHKSYYSPEDINILDEYRTVANVGLLEKIPKVLNKLRLTFQRLIQELS